jgi:hypothetical protein
MMGTNIHDSLLSQHAKTPNTFIAAHFGDIDAGRLPNC